MFNRNIWYKNEDFSGMTAEASARYADDLRKMYMGCLRTRMVVFGLLVAMVFSVFGVMTVGALGLTYGIFGMGFGTMFTCMIDYEVYLKAVSRVDHEMNEISQREMFAEWT